MDNAKVPPLNPGQRRLRVCLVGAGAIGQRVAELVAQSLSHSVELVAIAERPERARAAWWPSSAQLLTDPRALAEMRPDIVLEAAGQKAVVEWGGAALRCARKLIVCSASALTDDAVLESLRQTAQAFGSQLVVAHGALGGMQALSAASVLPLSRVTHTIRKPPQAWKDTPAETIVQLSSVASATILFEGNARDAARSYPANANAVVLSSLAGLGLDRTFVRLVADPFVTRNVHEVEATGAFGEFSFRIENEPMPSNPKTSDMTALSLVKMLEADVGPLIV